jgi:hypothetical protein
VAKVQNVKPSAASAPVPPAEEIQVWLVLFSEKHGSDLAQLRLSPAEFAALQQQAATHSASFEGVLERGLKRMTRTIPTTELEFAMRESNALLQMLMDKLNLIAAGPDDFSGPRVEQFLNGTGLIVSNAMDKLTQACDNVFNAVHGDLEVQS